MGSQLKTASPPTTQAASGLVELLYPYPEGATLGRPVLTQSDIQELLDNRRLNLRPTHNEPGYGDSRDERACSIASSRADISPEGLLVLLAESKMVAEELCTFRPQEVFDHPELSRKVAAVLELETSEVVDKVSAVLRGLSE